MNKNKILTIIKETVSSDRFKKILKITIKLAIGACIVFFVSVNLLGHTQLLSNVCPSVSAFSHSVVTNELFVDNFAVTDFNLLKEVSINNGIRIIAASYKCSDVSFLKYVVNLEKKFNLQPCELLALLSVENSFTDRTIVESDGITSYNVSQMRYATALDAYRILKNKGISIKAPTEELLRNDKHYVAELTAGYLQFLHERYPNPLEAWTSYNAGMGAAEKFRAAGFIYKYTTNMVERIQEFTSIMTG